MAAKSVTDRLIFVAIAAVPALPGATKRFLQRLLLAEKLEGDLLYCAIMKYQN